ncbi:MAG: SDR family oxidoreductase [Rhodothermales bacterium]
MDLTGKVCLVTGATAGIGKATAVHLARLGAHVVIVCRNAERGEPALSHIRHESGNPEVELLTADLSSQRAIRDLAEAFKRTHERLDVLINNAGLYLSERTETADGIETTWAVNHLAPFLLTNLLLDLIKRSAPSRIVTVSSEAHRGIGIDFDDPGMANGYNWLQAYKQSKLGNVLFTYELARRLEGTGVTTTCLHPGVVATRIWNRNSNVISLLMRPLKLFMTSPEESAEAVVRLAVSPELEGVTGTYFKQKKEVRSSRASHDEEMARQLWHLSEQMTGLDAAG